MQTTVILLRFVLKVANLFPSGCLNLGTLQLWDKILKIDPTPAYNKKAIYQIWSNQTFKQWKLDLDEVKSAKILIDKVSKNVNSLYSVQSVFLHEEEGFTAIAFSLPDILHQWGGCI